MGGHDVALPEGHRVAGLDGCGVNVLHINKGAHGILGLHAAGKDRIGGEARKADPGKGHDEQQKRYENNVRNNACYATHCSVTPSHNPACLNLARDLVNAI